MGHSVFLDRDGTINVKAPEGAYICRARDVMLLPRAADAIRRLNHAGLPAIVVTNQRGIARGMMTGCDLDAVHSELRSQLERAGAQIDAIYVCPHEEGTCGCRKPRPGLLLSAAEDFEGIDLSASTVIGDSERDVLAGRAVGARAIRIGRDGSSSRADHVVADLWAAVDIVLDGKIEASGDRRSSAHVTFPSPVP
jgi:D-glycero-D-manno-heptose 1,7-bisphosphate phosphatase